LFCLWQKQLCKPTLQKNIAVSRHRLLTHGVQLYSLLPATERHCKEWGTKTQQDKNTFNAHS
jgi:hypothetical protein